MKVTLVDKSAKTIVSSIAKNRMVIQKHVREYRRGISLTRKLSGNPASQNDADSLRRMSEKILNSMSSIVKSKITMQNHWKSLFYMKKSLIDSKYIFYQYWFNVSQRFSNSTLTNIRSFRIPRYYLNKNDVNKDTVTDNKIANEKIPPKAAPIELEQATPVNKQSRVILQKQSSDDIINNTDDHIADANLKTEKYSESIVTTDQVIQNTKDQILALPQVLSDFFVKYNPMTKDATTLATVPRWKSNSKTSITKQSIIARTKHVLNSIHTAESNSSQLRRVNDLILHLEQYPEARYHAIKEGVIRTLLKARVKTEDEDVNASIREALAVVGYVDPVPKRGIRILAIDGGGIRGLVAIEMLKQFERLTGQRVHEMFDYMCGVSTGAILLANLGSGRRKSLDEISDLYKILSTKIFTQSAILGTSTLMWSHAYYDTTLWEKMLIEQIGDEDLIKTTRDPTSPKFSAIATVSNNDQVMPYIFRNYTLSPKGQSHYVGSHRHKLWQAVRASAAAPTYFEEFKYGNYMLSDGGILVNNPCGVAIHEAKRLWPNTPIQCVISLGTGRIPPTIPCNEEISETTMATSWKEKFYKILASATDTEGVHTMLNELLPEHVYYRFNPYLTEMVSMDEVRPEKWNSLEQDAHMYIRKNDDKILQAVAALQQEKTFTDKMSDWVQLRKQMMGL